MTTTAQQVNLDITVTCATNAQAMQRNQSAIEDGVAARQAEARKRSTYSPYTVTPLAVEIHGRMGDASLDFLQQILQHTDQRQRTTLAHIILQRLSTTLQRHNATIIANYIDEHKL